MPCSWIYPIWVMSMFCIIGVLDKCGPQGFTLNPPSITPANFSVGVTLVRSVSAIPIPAAAWLFGTALVRLIGIGKRRKAA